MSGDKQLQAGPVTSLRSRKRIRPIRQSEMAECGIAGLAMISSYWGKDIDLAEMRRRFTITSRGMTLADLMKCASALQLSARPLRVEVQHLDEITYPALVHWDMNHYVVAERYKNGKLYIIDPAHGAGAWHDSVSLGDHFTGIIMEIEPASGFEPETAKRKLSIKELWGRADGFISTIAQAIILSLLLQIFVLAAPYFIQISVDEAVPANDADLVTVLGLAFITLALIAGIAHAMRAYVLLSAGTKLSYAMSSNIARHMLRLPIAWFEKRSVGDILSRFQSVQPLRIIMTEGMAAAILDGLMAILTLAALVIYSPGLAAVPVLSIIAYTALRMATLSRERATEGQAIIAMGKEQGTMIETLRGMTTIRLSGREAMRQAAWQNRLTDMLSQKYAHDKIRATQQAGAYLLEGLETIIVVWIGITLVMNGGFSVGMLFAFAAWRLQFSTAARRVVDQGAAWRVAKLHLERLSDIAFTTEDEGFSEPEMHGEPIAGKIELKNISHRYSEHEPLVLENINLVIEPGENVAITGPSGSGKSTLIRIMLGLIDPTSGEILVDDVPVKKYGRRAYRSQVGAVLQGDTLFAGSVADNVSGFTGVDADRLEKCLKAASIHEDISQMPMKENTLVGDMGSTLSGGQKQRVLIARALYRDPQILVLDEGTSELDAAHEANVNQTISSMGITRIGIAHRRETIDAAERVITIAKGTLQSDEVKERKG